MPNVFKTRTDSKKKDDQMDKNDLIACIREINKSASPEFLNDFTPEELTEYLERLMELDAVDVTVTN
jgi:hypothetical protein